MRLFQVASLSVFLLLVVASSESHAVASPAAEELEPSGSVLIEGRRVSLTQIQEEIDQLDDAFYESFNEVNTIPEYETHCFLHASVGTRIKQRYCHPVFVEDIRKNHANAFLQGMWVQSGGGPAVTHMGAASVPVSENRKYLKHLIETTLKHPDLLALREQRYKLIRIHESESRKSRRFRSDRKKAPEREAVR